MVRFCGGGRLIAVVAVDCTTKQVAIKLLTTLRAGEAVEPVQLGADGWEARAFGAWRMVQRTAKRGAGVSPCHLAT
jgi:hypothetical protein